jgi:hypothetical protein
LAIQEGEVSFYYYLLIVFYADTFNSAFIRDLVTFPSDQAIELAPIELDYNSKIVRYFIDFVISGSTTNAQISMTEFEALFQLSDKFITEKVDKALLVAMELRVQHRLASKGLDPWAVFRLAAARDYPELARASIRAFEGAELLHSSIYEYDVSRFDGVSGKYVGGLMHAGYHKRHTWNNHRNTMTETIECRKWSEVADYFRVE